MAEHSRHPSLDISDEQEANLRKLAAYLLTLPADYPDFEMKSFVISDDRELRHTAHVPACGTAACAVGHGPHAGIAPEGYETWEDYSVRLSGFEAFSGEWQWLFAGDWSCTDNTVHGAARRIIWLLENGLPKDSYPQRRGEAPLYYALASAQASS